MITRAKMILGAPIRADEVYDLELKCGCGKKVSHTRPENLTCAACGEVVLIEMFWKDSIVKYLNMQGLQAFRDSIFLSKELPFFNVRSMNHIEDLEDPILAVGMLLASVDNDSDGKHPAQIALSQIKYMRHRVRIMMEDMKLEERPLGVYLGVDAIKVSPAIVRNPDEAAVLPA